MKGLGHHFGGSGAPFWSHFGGLGGFWLPNACWEAFLAALGRFYEPRWLQLESQDGSKLEPKRHKKSMRKSVICLMPLKIDFWWNVNGFSEENGGKLAPKSDPKSISAL